MSQPHPELLILVVVLVSLALIPVASKLVRQVGDQISSEIDGGRSGDDLDEHLDGSYDGTSRDDEIAQMLAARAYLRGERVEDQVVPEPGASRRPAAPPAAASGADDELLEEIRQVVVAGNERRARMGEPLLDVDAEVARRLRQLGGG